ncbi:MAG: 30S ribosomal protein S8 [Syntrophales bacterium]|jgi:small subunit ribosomal protein S8|nr:30S ribosomal protein S8 [Syntrophales bacterium]MCK9527876.1 30S ribosomal protein S8 [Syntrophales bacterium]MDX9921950.1 30S ribosomal protein S8 [Syntrophales bacterium]
MAITDPIADMLTRIRNANRNKVKSVDVLLSKMNTEIAKVLKRTGYINGYDVKKEARTGHNMLRIYLKYSQSKETVIRDLQRISKPSRRIYAQSQSIPPVLNGYGVAIVSTSKGVMTDKEARALNVGGELICGVW